MNSPTGQNPGNDKQENRESGENFESLTANPGSLAPGRDLLGQPAAQIVLPGMTRQLTLREFLSSEHPMRLLWKSENERSETLMFEFAKRGVPQQVIRWTGWAGGTGEYADELASVANAFVGVKGFHMFGGTQIHDIDTGATLPSVCEIPVALKRADSDLILVGIIPKVTEEPKYVPGIGIVVSVRPERGQFTSINSDQNIGIVLQPDVNGTYNWIDEAKESHRQVSKFMSKGWAGTLVICGGSVSKPDSPIASTVEQELRMWAQTAKQNPNLNLNIILVDKTGGVAEKFANDQNWLADKPFVKVVNPSRESIRSAATEIGMETSW